MTTPALLVVIFLFSAFLSSRIVTAQTPDNPSLALKSAKQNFVLGEPIIVDVTLHTSQEPYELSGTLLDECSFEVAAPDGKTVRRKGGAIPCSPLGTMTRTDVVNPGSAFTDQANLLYEAPDIFTKAGSYTVTALLKRPASKGRGVAEASDKFRSNKVTIRVQKPGGVDAEAFRLMWPSGTDGETLGDILSVDPQLCHQLLAKFPSSAYAPYAYFYLADYYRSRFAEQLIAEGKPDKVLELPPGELDKSVAYYRQTLADPRASALSAYAQWGLARTFFIWQDYMASRREAEKVIVKYPNTRAAREAAKLLGEAVRRSATK